MPRNKAKISIGNVNIIIALFLINWIFKTFFPENLAICSTYITFIIMSYILLVNYHIFKEFFSNKNNYNFIIFFSIIFASNLINYLRAGNLTSIIKTSFELVFLFTIVIFGYIVLKRYGEAYVIHGCVILERLILIASIYGIFEYIFTYNPLLPYFNTDYLSFGAGNHYLYRSASVFSHPIRFANIVLVAFIINLFLNKGIKRIIHGLIFGLSIFFTQTRSVWISIVALFIIHILFEKKHVNKINNKTFLIALFYCFIFIIIIAVCIKLGALEIILKRFENIENDISYQQRSMTINAILKKLRDGPILNYIFGYGHDMSVEFMAHYKTIIKDFTTTDVGWISVLYNNGLITLLLCTLFYITNLREIHLTDVNFFKIVCYINIANALSNIFSELMNSNYMRFLMLFFIGVYISYRSYNTKEHGHI